MSDKEFECLFIAPTASIFDSYRVRIRSSSNVISGCLPGDPAVVRDRHSVGTADQAPAEPILIEVRGSKPLHERPLTANRRTWNRLDRRSLIRRGENRDVPAEVGGPSFVISRNGGNGKRSQNRNWPRDRSAGINLETGRTIRQRPGHWLLAVGINSSELSRIELTLCGHAGRGIEHDWELIGGTHGNVETLRDHSQLRVSQDNHDGMWPPHLIGAGAPGDDSAIRFNRHSMWSDPQRKLKWILIEVTHQGCIPIQDSDLGGFRRQSEEFRRMIDR
ncbi:hypothetical protein KOR42_50130 [Thalassoglobus neptunius]|uniref:Uncharacterized protein n=1 Tax=Thalassoglobus neptunius TaxID=1938619 RepID=A0A5C5VNC9_9PLAN|nr:hypothetical protein KOR42_50130 [Thalassoglobus neptunius]